MSDRNLDGRWISYGEAVAASGIDNRALRNGLDRGALSVGQKLRIGRWVFSIRDVFELLIIAVLARSAYIPVSRAGQVAKMLSPYLDELLAEYDASHRSEDYDAIQAVLVGLDEEFSVYLTTDLNDILGWKLIGERSGCEIASPDEMIGAAIVAPYTVAKIVFSIEGPMAAVLMLCERAEEHSGTNTGAVTTQMSVAL